jgi:hypothetical protein
VKRIEAHEKRTMLAVEVPAEGGREAVDKQLQAFKVQEGDEIHIFPIASYNENGIYLQGHVLRPGRYSFHEGQKLTDIIGSYKDLLPEPAPHYAEIIRLNARISAPAWKASICRLPWPTPRRHPSSNLWIPSGCSAATTSKRRPWCGWVVKCVRPANTAPTDKLTCGT